jgi:hypothetical protein
MVLVIAIWLKERRCFSKKKLSHRVFPRPP